MTSEGWPIPRSEENLALFFRAHGYEVLERNDDTACKEIYGQRVDGAVGNRLGFYKLSDPGIPKPTLDFNGRDGVNVQRVWRVLELRDKLDEAGIGYEEEPDRDSVADDLERLAKRMRGKDE